MITTRYLLEFKFNDDCIDNKYGIFYMSKNFFSACVCGMDTLFFGWG